jgi:hypothetical protein
MQLGQTYNAKLIGVDRKPLQPGQFDGLDLIGYVDTSESNLNEAVKELPRVKG